MWKRASLLVRLVVVEGLNFTSPLYGNFLALLAELDLARTRYRRARPPKCVYMENFQPSFHVNKNKFYKGFHREARTRKKGSVFLRGLAHFYINTT